MKNVFFAFLFFSLAACKAQDASQAKMKPDGFEKAITAENIQVLDVRTAAEYSSGHIKNSLQADWNNQPEFLDRVKYIDKDKPVYIYCLAGGRSNAAANWMRSNGFKNVTELDGGINAWKGNNKPLEGSSDVPQMTMEQYSSSIPNDKTMLVDFGAAWCPPCIKMLPVITELESSNTIIKVDAGVHTDLMKQLNIETIPVFIVYKEGKEVWRRQGIVSKEELLAQLK